VKNQLIYDFFFDEVMPRKGGSVKTEGASSKHKVYSEQKNNKNALQIEDK
jgi:hypothetical protein